MYTCTLSIVSKLHSDGNVTACQQEANLVQLLQKPLEKAIPRAPGMLPGAGASRSPCTEMVQPARLMSAPHWTAVPAGAWPRGRMPHFFHQNKHVSIPTSVNFLKYLSKFVF